MSARHDEITLKKRLMDRSDTIGQRPELRQARTIGNWRGREKQTALLRFPPKTSKKNPRNAQNKSKEEREKIVCLLGNWLISHEKERKKERKERYINVF